MESSKEIQVWGEHNTAVIKTDIVEEAALDQVRELTNLKELEDSKIVMMPDIHAGKGATIGTTMLFDNLKEAQVNPEWVGNDISCGLTTVKIGKAEDIDIDFDGLDELSKTLNEPAGLPRELNTYGFSTNLWKRIGRVSSGNHFMSIDEMDGYYYVTVHNGSLSLGQEIYKKYTELANNKKTHPRGIINALKEEGKSHHIEEVLKKIKELDEEDNNGILSRYDLENYLLDIQKCEDYAFMNRIIVIQRVLETIFYKSPNDKWEVKDGKLYLLQHLRGEIYEDENYTFPILNSPHNYIKQREGGEIVIHKGACSAELGEPVLIPINMRDGIIIGKGKGNPDWNYAAPHGAGRVMSRTKARKNIDLDTYLDQLKDVKSISINENTLDEAPDAYKSLEYILERIGETVEVIGIMKPVYNFKVSEELKPWERKK